MTSWIMAMVFLGLGIYGAFTHIELGLTMGYFLLAGLWMLSWNAWYIAKKMLDILEEMKKFKQ